MFLIGNAVNGVKLIVYRYKSYSIGWKKNLNNIVTSGDIVPPQTREVVHNDTVNFACKDVSDHLLKRWALRPFTAKAIIDIVPWIQEFGADRPSIR